MCSSSSECRKERHPIQAREVSTFMPASIFCICASCGSIASNPGPGFLRSVISCRQALLSCTTNLATVSSRTTCHLSLGRGGGFFLQEGVSS